MCYARSLCYVKNETLYVYTLSISVENNTCEKGSPKRVTRERDWVAKLTWSWCYICINTQIFISVTSAGHRSFQAKCFVTPATSGQWSVRPVVSQTSSGVTVVVKSLKPFTVVLCYNDTERSSVIGLVEGGHGAIFYSLETNLVIIATKWLPVTAH